MGLHSHLPLATRRPPRVNLLRQRSSFSRLVGGGDRRVIGLAAVALASWVIFAIALANLLGFHLHFGSGP